MRKRRGVIILSLTVALLLQGGCGKVNTKSPEAVVKSLLTAYQDQKEENAKKSFGLDPKEKCAEEIQQEIDYYMNLFKAHEAEDLTFEKSKSIGKSEGKELVYVLYNYEIKTKKETQKLPGLSFYFVKEKDDKYYVVPAKEVTEDMSKYSGKEYKDFVKTEEYKAYEKEYQEFSRKNPQYEKSMESRFQDLLNKKK